MNADIDFLITKYGFVWGDILVERTAIIKKPRTIHVLRVYCPNGHVVELQIGKRKNQVTIHPKE